MSYSCDLHTISITNISQTKKLNTKKTFNNQNHLDGRHCNTTSDPEPRCRSWSSKAKPKVHCNAVLTYIIGEGKFHCCAEALKYPYHPASKETYFKYNGELIKTYFKYNGDCWQIQGTVPPLEFKGMGS